MSTSAEKTEALSQSQVAALGLELFRAMRDRRTVEPLSSRFPALTVGDAYRISLSTLDLRVADGERIIGKKIGLTSKPVQRTFNVLEPDFGYLTDAMLIRPGAAVCIDARLIQPRAEAEIAFTMRQDLQGPGVSALDVLRAVEFAVPCFEIVDSRIRDWNIRLTDTIADNASSGVVVLGTSAIDPRSVDLSLLGCVVEKNGELLSTGAGAAALGSPLNSVAWLANTLGRLGVTLRAGEVILSGSLVPLEPVKSGDIMSTRIDRLGSLTVRFV